MKKSDEWFAQAFYDFETAEYLFLGNRYTYTVFMCHLSVEKALKGLYFLTFNQDPPKTHNLTFFTGKLQQDLPDTLNEFIFEINQASIPTRYPDDLTKMSADYTAERVALILQHTKEVLSWIKQQETSPHS